MTSQLPYLALRSQYTAYLLKGGEEGCEGIRVG
jgi:hypothetical protein